MAEGARPIEDVQDISAITYGFMASKALFSALEFDVFTHIAQGADLKNALASAHRHRREQAGIACWRR